MSPCRECAEYQDAMREVERLRAERDDYKGVADDLNQLLRGAGANWEHRWREERREIDLVRADRNALFAINAQLRALLNALRIYFKNVDRRPHEAELYATICRALEDSPP